MYNSTPYMVVIISVLEKYKYMYTHPISGGFEMATTFSQRRLHSNAKRSV